MLWKILQIPTTEDVTGEGSRGHICVHTGKGKGSPGLGTRTKMTSATPLWGQ